MGIDYEIEFVNPKFQELYGGVKGSISGARAGEPYAIVRKSLGQWIADMKRADGDWNAGGAVPKFRFLRLVVDGKRVV